MVREENFLNFSSRARNGFRASPHESGDALICCGVTPVAAARRRSGHDNRRTAAVKSRQAAIPAAVGIAKASAVYFHPPVSFRMVSSVVEQGQCIREKSSVLTAVAHVQPLAVSSARISGRLSMEKRLPREV